MIEIKVLDQSQVSKIAEMHARIESDYPMPDLHNPLYVIKVGVYSSKEIRAIR